MARPTKLTATLLDKLEAIADDGRSLKSVCAHIDIETDTFRSWESLPDDHPNVARFHGLAARVRARANAGMLDKCDGVIVTALDDPDVKPAEKAALAIQYKRLVGPQRVELSGPDGGPIRSAGPDLSKLSAAELRTLRELTSKAEAGGES